MTKTHRTHRIAIVALSASLVLPIAPVFGQAAPVVVAPPSPVSAAPPPVAVTPPPPVAVAPPPAARPAPPPAPAARAAPAQATPAARDTRSATRTARPAPRARVAAPDAAPAPAATPAPAPIAEAPLPLEAAPIAAPPASVSVTATEVTGTATPRGSTLPWLIAGLALFAGLVGFALLRRRRSREEVYEDHYEEQPAYVEERVATVAPAYQPPIVQPAMVAPLPSFRRDQPAVAAEAAEIESDVEEVNEVETSAADIEALGAADTTHRNRPWLEMLMRPIRAGANGEDTVVEFSLTVGNTGGVPAEDVRISAWMLGTQGSEAEGLLIDPPAGAILSETRIEAGDGATVEATVSMPRQTFDRAMLPIVVTDARYTLPDGGEGRTSACFAVGLPIGEELVPFPANAASGLNEGVEARVHCEVEHV